MNWIFTCMPVRAELVYIKHFQIFGYVNKCLTTFAWLDTSKLLMFRVKVPEKNYLVRKCINHPKARISIWAINGSQNNLSPILKFSFDCKSLVVGYDIKVFVSHSGLTMMPFFTKMTTPPLVSTNLSVLYMS